MTLKVGQVYKNKAGQDVKILAIDIKHPTQPGWSAVGIYLHNGAVCWFYADGSCLGNTNGQLVIPQSNGFMVVYPTIKAAEARSHGIIVPVKYDAPEGE